jgi:hypothetical protein
MQGTAICETERERKRECSILRGLGLSLSLSLSLSLARARALTGITILHTWGVQGVSLTYLEPDVCR